MPDDYRYEAVSRGGTENDADGWDADRQAWILTCDVARIAAEIIADSGTESEHILRACLWDKVGRAFRRAAYPADFAFEEEMLAERVPERAVGSVGRTGLCRAPNAWARSLMRVAQSLRLKRRRRDEKVLYIVFSSPRLHRAVMALEGPDSPVLVSGMWRDGRPPRAIQMPKPVYSSGSASPAVHAACEAIAARLASHGTPLWPGDETGLRDEIAALCYRAEAVREDLRLVRPDAILLHADNHPPYQDYVLAARELGIPSVVLQHGLDCERNVYDELYADAFAAWGPERLERYNAVSHRQPRHSAITGNPSYSGCRIPRRIRLSGAYWLWTTRPHIPEKCFAPSRMPREGLDILDAILDALRSTPGTRLVIKPHPFDYAESYSKRIAECGMTSRVSVSTHPLFGLLQDARLVISEDSTSGLDAMLCGKVLVHAHLAKTAPVMPFADYGAAIAGYSAEMLKEALAHAENIPVGELERMHDGQQRFADYFGGPRDERFNERFTVFVDKVFELT